MKRSQNLVLTALYKGSKKFLNDYFNSINKQNCKDFDLLLVYDNVQPFNLPKTKIKIFKNVVRKKISHSLIRYKGIKYGIKNKYKNIIFTDIDDTFSNNRIAVSLKELKKYDFVFNEMSVVDNLGKVKINNIYKNLLKKKNFFSYQSILDCNYLGLSNTALKLKLLKNFLIPKNIMALDWCIYTTLLLNGAKGKYINNAKTFYRQHNENYVGLMVPLNNIRLFKGIDVKEKHFKYSFNYCKKKNLFGAKFYYSKQIKKVSELKKALQNIKFRKKYINTINFNLKSIYNGWWSEILTLNQYQFYAK